ncbi:MAG: hypothetical protein JW889_10820 [Verrucomicrobia bacterium]|nr:hypothetical protein [Verrucomicrobiota bacterium]
MRMLLLVPITVLLVGGCFGPSSEPQVGPMPDAPNALKIIRLEPGVPATLHPGDRLHVVVRYRTSLANGVRIFARPFTSGQPTPGYKAHPSGLHHGEDEMTGWFTFDKPAKVHRVRVQMVDATDENRVIAEAWHTVNSQWVQPSSDGLEITGFEPAVPATLHPGDRLHVTVHYRMQAVAGVKIFVRPFTNDQPTPGYKAHGSPTYGRGNGELVGWFTFDQQAKVHRVRVQMVDAADPDHVIAETWHKVNSQWVKP